MKNPFSLENKSILVTGASSGIGRSVAIECSQMGATVVLSGRNEERLAETYNSLKGDNHSVIIADIQQEDALDSIVKRVPVLNGIVHSAGIVKTMPFPFFSKQIMDDMFLINFFAPVFLTQKIIKNKKLGQRASIVFIASIDGLLTAHIGNAIYSSTKGALAAMSRNMAVDLAGKGIRVNNVLPGMIETPLIDSDAVSQEQRNKDKQLYPLKRYGKPEEVAYAVIYLLSDASSFTTGINLVVDGGFTIL
ncbi:MAG: SDR family oxidoreductase [Bacteroidales bacterium]|jgi:NAD(P)-dependent dehydrogenase (short-subunit alcohol dehydrogenase family)|nr:SDR family oxidoreductase [Bacteroidales bacterium]